MPCWSLLGVEICIPSLDDIVNAVVSPITTALTSAQASITDTLAPLFDLVTSSISGALSAAAQSITDFFSGSLAWLTDTLGAAYDVVCGLGAAITASAEGLWTAISSGLAALQIAFSDGLTAASGAISGALSAAQEAISGALAAAQNELASVVNDAGAVMSGALEGAQEAMLTAFDGMGNALSGAIGGLFSGFGQIDTTAVVSSAIGTAGLLESAIAQLAAFHSPITPLEASAFVPNFIIQVHAAAVSLHIANTVAEAASLGQIDVSLTEAWSYPNTASAMSLAADLASMPIKEGLMPAYKRYILSNYVPLIPDFQTLISIYVKEGYMEEKWVEMPGEMATNFRDLGYGLDWASRIWGAHWQYPNPSQLFEMLHRTAGNFPEIGVTDEVLRSMLKLHDYEPKWRAPLEAISWRTWRIYDVRTGWEMGDLSDDDLVKRLIDTGYEPKDAQLVADVQKLTVLRSEIDRLLGETDQDFIEGWINEDTLRADYGSTPFRKDVADLRISRVLLRRDREVKKDLKLALENRFIKGDLSEKEYTEALSKLGITQAWIKTVVELALAKKLTKVKEETSLSSLGLTEARYSRAFKLGILTEAEYKVKLQALKYSTDDIDLLVELNSPEKPSPEELPTLTLGELKAAFRAAILDENELGAELDLRRYTAEDIQLIIDTEKSKIKPAIAG